MQRRNTAKQPSIIAAASLCVSMSDSMSSPPMLPTSPAQGIDYELFLDCVHCGLCTSSCPTYVERGDENDGPRGRIYLMRAVADGRIPLDEKVAGHLELCLD